MADFETVLGRLQQAEGLDRGGAIARLKELNDDGQIPEGKVTGLDEGLLTERAKSIGERFGTGVVGGLTEIPEKILSYVPGASNFESPHETMLKHIQSEVEPTKYAEGVGELVGSATAYGAPFEALEEGIGATIPKLGGDGFLATTARRAISGGILGGASTGTFEGAKTWAKYGAILPPVIETAFNVLGGVGGVIGAKLGDLLSRAGEESDIEPEYSRVKEEPKQLTGPPTIEGPVRSPTHQDFVAYPAVDKPYVAPQEHLSPDDVPLGPVDKPKITISGKVEPEAQPVFAKPATTPLTEAQIRAKIKSDLAIRSKVAKAKARGASDAALAEAGVNNPRAGAITKGSVFNPVVRKSPDLTPGQYVGTRDVVTGQPFEGTTTVHLQSNNGDVYINRTNPNADLGQPRPVSLKNPAVLMVSGNNPYREALAKLFPDSPQLLESFDRAEEPDATAREVLGQFIQRRGHDGLILKTDDVSKDIIVDFKNFTPSKIPITPTELSTITSEPPKGVFARALKGDEPTKTLVAPNISTLGQTEYNLDNPNDLDTAIQVHGFDDAKNLARAIRASKFTPFEMYENTAKGLTAPPPISRADLTSTHSDVDIISRPLQALSNRYPKLAGIIDQVRLTHQPDAEWLARTGYLHGTNKIAMEVNTAFLPNKRAGVEVMKSFKFPLHQGQEFITTTLEHELTHAAQFWLDDRKLGSAFGSPEMGALGPHEQIESQAQNRDRALQSFFQAHDDLKQRVAQVPEEVRVAALKAHGAEERAKLKPVVRRKFNQLSGKHTVRVFERKIPKPTATDFENMDAFDASSRGGPIDSQIDPDLYYSPELKSMLGAMQKAGMKWGGWFSSIRNAWDVTDNEDHQWFIARVFQLAREMHVEKAKFNKRLGAALADYEVEDKNYDKLWEAVEGLRRAPDGSLSQTVAGVDEKTAKTAVAIREKVFDPAYEHITGIDRKAPAIVKSYNLPDTKEQWWRLKQLQSGQRAAVKNPTLDEFGAANATRGMLNFDESHDLRGEYVDGYITHQPIANERTELLNQIAQVDRIAELTGVTDPTGQALRAARVKRLAEIELDLAKAYVRSGPRTDVLPSKHYFGPTVVKDHPGAASVLVDKNIPQIAGRYVNGVVSKRYFDQILHEFGKIAKTLPGSVRDYDVHYINNLRGIRGYSEDVGLTNFINDVQKRLEKTGVKLFNRVSINDVRRSGDFAVQLQTFTKLLMTPIRFPAVQTTHLLMTTWPAAGSRATARGLAYFLSHPKQAVMEAMARGVVERDAEFLGAMDGVTPTTQGNLLKYSQAFSKYSDYFRKAVSWHTFRLQAMEPGFKPSPMAKTFIKDVPGRGTIAMSRDYADAMTDRTQFRLRAEGKPTAFVGGQVRRAITQFKPWMINYGTFFKDVAKSGDPGMQARLLAALYFVGGPTAVLGGDLVYNYARTELIKHFGYVLPSDTGFQQVANHLGWGGLIGDVDLLSLRSPIGLPSDPENVLPWLAGPTLGTLWDVGKGIHDAKGDTGKEIKSTLSAISPEARALIDAGEEWRQGGVKSPMGEILAKRPTSSVVIRGLDLSPSVKSQRYNYRNDIVTALQSGHPDTARQLLTQAKSKGIIFGPKDMGQIRATVKHYLKGQKLFERDPESALR